MATKALQRPLVYYCMTINFDCFCACLQYRQYVTTFTNIHRAAVQSSMCGTVQLRRRSIKDLVTGTEIPTSTSLRHQYIEFNPQMVHMTQKAAVKYPRNRWPQCGIM